MFFKLFRSILDKYLIRNVSDKQLVYSFLLGAFISFIPENNFVDFFLVFAILVFKFNFLAAFIGWILFFGLQLLLIPVMHAIGTLFLIQIPFLTFFVKILYHIPFLAYLNLNYTVVLGAYVVYVFLFLLLVPFLFRNIDHIRLIITGQKSLTFFGFNEFLKKTSKHDS
tara:strand:- start:570 stop:1073 length:504 start_codon:yes stop_codon:yes gene_type:complete